MGTIRKCLACGTQLWDVGMRKALLRKFKSEKEMMDTKNSIKALKGVVFSKGPYCSDECMRKHYAALRKNGVGL